MRCFYHHDRDAIGTCKSCNKGICPDCAVDLTKGLACKDYCEEEVKELIALIEQNVAGRAKSAVVMNSMKANTYIQSMLYLTFAIFFLVFSFIMDSESLSPPMAFMGFVFLAISGYALWRGFRIPG